MDYLWIIKESFKKELNAPFYFSNISLIYMRNVKLNVKLKIYKNEKFKTITA
jgi:hypothetical protein